MNDAVEVLCAGIIVADHLCTPVTHVPAPGELVTADGMLLTIGGCAANTVADLARIGVRAAVVGRVGADVFGRVVTDLLREAGVDVSALTASTTAATSQTLIVNVRGQDRRFIHSFGANAEFAAADVPRGLLEHARALYVGGYLVMPSLHAEELAPVFAAARARGVLTVLDVVVPGPGDYVGRLRPLLPHVDVFLPNHDEAALITGEHDPVRQAEFFRSLGCGTVVITMGGAGCVLVEAGRRLRAGVFAVPLVDATGGGDAFDAGYIDARLRGLGPEDCLRVASALGASCVRAIGTTPGVFTRAECDAFLRTHTLAIEAI